MGGLGGEPFLGLVAPGVGRPLIFVQNVGVHARIPARAVGAVFFDQVRALAEPGVVLRVMPARLGDVIAERQVHLVAHELLVVDFGRLADRLVDQGVGVLAVQLEIEVPGLVIDAGAGVGHIVVARPDPAGQHAGGALHAVAQAGQAQIGLAGHGAAEHRHRVGVVQHGHIRLGVALDVASDIEHDRDRAQGAEDARHAARIADVHIHAIFLGDFNIVAPDANPAGQDGDQDEVGVLQRLLAVGGRHHFGRVIAHLDDA